MKLKTIVFTELFYPTDHMPLTEGDPTNPGSSNIRMPVQMVPLASTFALRDWLADVSDETTQVIAHTGNEMNFVLMREASGVATLQHHAAGLFNGNAGVWRMRVDTWAVIFDIGRRKMGDKGSVPAVVAMTLVKC